MINVTYVVFNHEVKYEEMFDSDKIPKETFESILHAQFTDNSCGIKSAFHRMTENNLCNVKFKAKNMCIDMFERSIWMPSNNPNCYLTIKFDKE